jgi:flagellar hook-length control protein FliK
MSNPFADRPAVPAGSPSGTAGTTPAFPAILAMPGTPATGSGDSQPGTPAAASLPSQTALQQRSEEGPELSAGLQAWNGGNNASSAAAPSGHLAGTAAASEMNVALRAEGLGAVQLHARVTGDQVGAAITVERHEAHAALAGDLPALHQALSDRQLRLETLSLAQGSPHSGAGIGEGSGRQQQQGPAAQRPGPSGGAAASFLGAAETTAPPEESATRTAFDSHGRLSVQA